MTPSTMTPSTFGHTIVYVPDVSAALEFYASAFGLTRRFVTPEGDYGELDTGTVTLAFADESLADTNLADGGGFDRLSASRPPAGLALTMLTDDVPAAIDQAIAAGATVYTDAALKPWGQLVAYVRDPSGVLIEVATPVSA